MAGCTRKTITGMIGSLNQIWVNSIWIMSLAITHHSFTLKRRADSILAQIFVSMAYPVLHMVNQLGSFLFLLTGMADSTRKTSLGYLTMILLIRISSLQNDQGRRIVPLDI